MLRVNREAWERGRMLQVLADNDALSCAMSFGLLIRTLDNLSISLSARELGGRLDYLAAKGYVELSRRKDLPGYDQQRLRRGAGRPDDIVAVKLTPKGLDLAQRTLPADPGVDLE